MTEGRLEALADRIAERLVDRVADRVAELVGSDQVAPELIDAAEVARRLGISRAAVYSMADELGAVRLGSGSKPRLRFDPRRIDAYGAGPADPKPSGNGNRRRRSGSRVELLPIRDGTTANRMERT